MTTLCFANEVIKSIKMSTRKPNIGFSYLLALAVVAFSRFAWLPWIVIYLHQRKYNSWAATVFGYGLLLSCFHIGQYLGHALTKSKSMNSSWFSISFMTLTGSFISLCFITRYTLILALFVIMGMSGMILTGVSINIDTNAPQLAILKRASELEINDTLERNLVSFAFAILIAGYLYNSHPLAQFPLYHLALALAAFCLLVLGYYVIISRMIKRRAPGIGGSVENAPGMSASDSTGSTAVVVDYNGPVPENFLEVCSGNLARARAMYGKALQWRQEKNVDHIFDIPQDHFHAILENYPHAIHGYSLDGCGVVYELLGRGSMPGIKAAGVTIDQVVWHMELRNELVFRRLLEPEYMRAQGAEPAPFTPDSTNTDVLSAPVRKMITVLDVAGVGLGSVNKDVLSFILRSGEIIDNYYPNQVSQLIVVNAPSWFSILFSTISAVLPASVRKKVAILYGTEGLEKYIHPSQRPVAYGGTGVELGKAQGHLDFLALEQKWRTSGQSSTLVSSAAAAGHVSTPTASSAPVAAPLRPLEEKRGLLSWFQRPQTAYLGEENTYKYNAVTRTWGEDVGASDATADNLSASTAPNRKGAPEKKPRTHGRGRASSDEDSSDELLPKRNKADKKRPASAYHATAHASNSEQERARRANVLKEKVDEHGMVLAIQAAQRAKRELSSLSNIEDGGNTGMNMRDLRRSMSFHDAADFRSVDTSSEQGMFRSHDDGEAGSGESRGNSTRESNFIPSKLSPQLFLIVLMIYCTCLWVQSALFSLIPVWLVIPVSAGGMEYSVREVTLVLSSTAMWCLLGHKGTSQRTDHMLKTSPIRALRLGCGLLLVVLFLLPFFLEYTVPNVDDPVDLPEDSASLSPADMEDWHEKDHRVQFITVFGRPLLSQMPVSYSTFISADRHNVAYDYVHWASSKYTFHTRSILALQLPSVLFSLILCGLQMCRRAAGILLQLTLANTFNDPSSVRRALNGLVEIGGPTLAASLFSLGYGMGLQYPMDASSFFSIAACQIMLVYIASILLRVQFRGDYGVMADYDEAMGGGGGGSASTQGTRYAQNDTNDILLEEGTSSASSRHAYQRGTRRTTAATAQAEFIPPEAPSRLSSLAQVFSIPLGDASLVYSPIFAAYGSKLYNLKDDFKDV